ncbi:MAG: JAB domain-containing protein [Desulfobacterales bacterium]|nr:JAB domain-containing protein [Desulfobacterales bacterium]
MVKDANISFGGQRLNNAEEAQAILRKLIQKHGQSDREHFCVILLNAKNEIIGMNIVSIGGLSVHQWYQGRSTNRQSLPMPPP